MREQVTTQLSWTTDSCGRVRGTDEIRWQGPIIKDFHRMITVFNSSQQGAIEGLKG